MLRFNNANEKIICSTGCEACVSGDVGHQNTSESFSFTWSLISQLTYATTVDDEKSDPLMRSGGVQDYDKMSLCRMCGWPVDFPNAHKDCVLCLGCAHAEAALKGSDCQACEELPIKILQARLAIARSCCPLAPASPPPSAFEPRAGRMQDTPSEGSSEGLTSAQRPTDRGTQSQALCPSSRSAFVHEHVEEHASAPPVDYFSGYGFGLMHNDHALIRAKN